jgi:hypothetical protein
MPQDAQHDIDSKAALMIEIQDNIKYDVARLVDVAGVSEGQQLCRVQSVE